MTLHRGQCLCGQVSFTIDAEPLAMRWQSRHQHDRAPSGSATVNVLFPEQAVHYQGEISTIRLTADSGNTVERGFCPQCGAQMFSRTVEPAGLPIRVRAGTLDDPELMAPQAQIWVSSGAQLGALDPNLPQHPKAPPPAA